VTARELAEGDKVITVRTLEWPHRNLLGVPTTVQKVTPTLIITADGQRWNRADRWPVIHGRNSRTRILSVHDDEVVFLRAQARLGELAQRADNLYRLNSRGPADAADRLAMLALDAARFEREIYTLMDEAAAANQPPRS
jgi:hypothetical protein